MRQIGFQLGDAFLSLPAQAARLSVDVMAAITVATCSAPSRLPARV
jgi:hypothetical protein